MKCCPVRSSVIATCTSTGVQRIHSKSTFANPLSRSRARTSWSENTDPSARSADSSTWIVKSFTSAVLSCCSTRDFTACVVCPILSMPA